jgi:transcriptional regulator with XRE-family HTH domain
MDLGREKAMRKIQLDGKKIKQLRDGRARAATQKEFAHEIRVSERRLRAIENVGTLVSSDVADRIAHALNMPVQALLIQDEGPPLMPAPSQQATETVKSARRTQLLPRFDETYASVVTDEGHLFDVAERSHVLVLHILTSLTSETSAYAEELISILRSLTWEARGRLPEPIDGLEQIALRRRIRELLVLLKGNDVWAFANENDKQMPESFEVQPHRDLINVERQIVIAFGPPDTDGELSTIKVPIDRGQPHILTWGRGAEDTRHAASEEPPKNTE